MFCMHLPNQCFVCTFLSGGGVIKLQELLQLSDRHSRHGRPARAQRRPTAEPSALRDEKCIMLVRMQTKPSSGILTPSPPKFFALPTR